MWFISSCCSDQLKRFEDALEQIDQALKAQPRDARYLLHRGLSSPLSLSLFLSLSLSLSLLAEPDFFFVFLLCSDHATTFKTRHRRIPSIYVIGNNNSLENSLSLKFHLFALVRTAQIEKLMMTAEAERKKAVSDTISSSKSATQKNNRSSSSITGSSSSITGSSSSSKKSSSSRSSSPDKNSRGTKRKNDSQSTSSSQTTASAGGIKKTLINVEPQTLSDALYNRGTMCVRMARDDECNARRLKKQFDEKQFGSDSKVQIAKLAQQHNQMQETARGWYSPFFSIIPLSPSSSLSPDAKKKCC